MSIQAGIGISDKPNAEEAGKDAVSQALDDVDKAKLILVFASVKYLQQHVINGASQAAKDVPIIGCSGAGEITNFGPTRGYVVAMAIGSDTIEFSTGVGELVRKSSKNAGKTLAEDIKRNAKEEITALIFFTDILTGNGADILKGIQDDFNNCLIMGGAAGDDFIFKETYVYHNNRALPSQLSGVGLSGEYSIGVGSRHGWVPIGLPVTVTKSHGAIVDELDNKPAVNFYEEHFGMKAHEMVKDSFAQLAITYPLGMYIEESSEMLIRFPMDIFHEGAIRFTAGIPTGVEVRLMLGSRNEIIKAAKMAARQAMLQLNGKPPKAAIIVNSIARNKLLAQHSKREIQAIQSVIGDQVPLIGYYAYGEYASIKSNKNGLATHFFHNETVTIILLGD